MSTHFLLFCVTGLSGTGSSFTACSRPGYSSATSQPCVTSIAPSLISCSVPAELSLSAFPGTAKICLPCSRASATNSLVPLFSGASTTTTPSESPAAIRFLARKCVLFGIEPAGYSETRQPHFATSSASSLLASSTEVPSTPMTLPPAKRAPSAAAASMPAVSPDMTIPPQRAIS